MEEQNNKDALRSMVTTIFKHLGISFVTVVFYILFMFVTQLFDESAITGMYVILVIVNCTAIICGRLSRIRQKLDEAFPNPEDTNM